MKIRFITSIFIFLVVPFTGCKKGDEDPFFTLASRKARISGTWKMTSINSEQEFMFDAILYSSSSLTGDETTISETMIYDSENYSNTYHLDEYSCTINKDGTWQMTRKYNFERLLTNSYYTETTTGADILTSSGNWSFIGKTKNVYKNKERVRFSILQSENEYSDRIISKNNVDPLVSDTTYTYASYVGSNTYLDGENSFVYDLIMLKSKEMKWQFVTENLGTTTYNSSNPPSTNTHTFSSAETIVWEAK